MTRPNTYRATPEHWAQCRDSAGRWDDATTFHCLLELHARVEALEVDANEDSASTHFCFDSIIKRLEALEAGATCPHVVTSDEGTNYCGLAEQQANSQPTPNDRQIRNSPAGRFEPSDDDPIPQRPAPDGSLVERVGRAISLDAWDDAGNWTAEARAAICAVAEWLRGQQELGAQTWAWHLEQEANR